MRGASSVPGDGRRRTRSFAAASVAVALGAAAAACTAPAPAPGPPVDGRVAVVASTDVYGSIVAAVGGDRVSVTSIIDSASADPHEYEATPADAAAVNRAKLLVLNGGGYDDFATELVDAAPAKPEVVNVVELSGLPGAPGAQEQGALNEHVWYSLPTMKKLADTLATDLGRIEPGDAATFTRNATTFKDRVDGLIGELDAIKAAHSGERVAVTEPVPLYVVQDAGLVDATPQEFSEAAEEGTDPPAAVLEETLALFTDRQVAALITNAQAESASTRQVERAATSAGVPQVPVTETLPTGVTDFVTWQGDQIDALASALATAS
jgi:zinc/manganese transport system substrate-binding protein